MNGELPQGFNEKKLFLRKPLIYFLIFLGLVIYCFLIYVCFSPSSPLVRQKVALDKDAFSFSGLVVKTWGREILVQDNQYKTIRAYITSASVINKEISGAGGEKITKKATLEDILIGQKVNLDVKKTKSGFKVSSIKILLL